MPYPKDERAFPRSGYWPDTSGKNGEALRERMEVCTYPHDGMTFRAYAAVAALPVGLELAKGSLDPTRCLPPIGELAHMAVSNAVLLAELLAEELHKT
jgi:hypothetical protein